MKNRENFSDLTELELQDKFHHYKEELFNLRLQAVTHQLTDNSRIAKVRKNIARVQTFINKMVKDKVRAALKGEYEHLIKAKGIDPMKTPLRERLSMLKGEISTKMRRLEHEIERDVDGKITEALTAIRKAISAKLKTAKGKDEKDLRGLSKRVQTVKVSVRPTLLDKLSGMGFNEASSIKGLKETKRQKLAELANLRAIARELTSGRLPF